MFHFGWQDFRRGLWRRSWLALAALCTFLFAAPPAHAGDGIGSVWVTDVLDTSFVVHWDFPSNTYAGPGRFEVCVKRPGSNVTACGNLGIPFTNPAWNYRQFTTNGSDRSMLITGMPQGERLKIKVKCEGCKKKKKTWLGKFFGNSPEQKLGTTEIKTAPSNPQTLQASLWASQVDPNHITLSWKWFGPGQPSANLHLCIKPRWEILNGFQDCKNGDLNRASVQIKDLNKTSITLGNTDTMSIHDSKNYLVYLVDRDKVFAGTKVTTPARP